ncbi:nucleotidyltransferase family protein [Polycladidibacter hongkongensis]|uniref:nucleotidyltransferase family protein n=1 Tax=Polycladidibacter hongkongensis TaxID=1647556 RepID=UPI00082DDCA7|nr:nucleotidyltransferase family protein [Pseudovibrio hongkongensis]
MGRKKSSGILGRLTCTRYDVVAFPRWLRQICTYLQCMPKLAEPEEIRVSEKQEQQQVDLPRLTMVMLAAGLSKRMQGENKLLLPVRRQPMVLRCAERLLSSGLGRLLVVTGFESERVEAALKGLDVTFVYNKSYRDGQASSIAAGVRAALAQPELMGEGVLVAKGDMPGLGIAEYRQVAARFYQGGCQRIVVPQLEGVWGYPVVLPPRLLDDVGCGELNLRKLVKAAEPSPMVDAMGVHSPAYLQDIDRGEDYARLQEHVSQR